MPALPPKFPTEQWDGTTAEISRLDEHITAGPLTTNQMTQEIVAIEKYLLAMAVTPGNTLGEVIAKQALYDATGTLVGYLPVYDDITQV